MHVAPPDTDDVTASIADIAHAATEAGMDFVVLTPHLWDGQWDEQPKRAPQRVARVREGRARGRLTDVDPRHRVDDPQRSLHGHRRGSRGDRCRRLPLRRARRGRVHQRQPSVRGADPRSERPDLRLRHVVSRVVATRARVHRDRRRRGLERAARARELDRAARRQDQRGAHVGRARSDRPRRAPRGHRGRRHRRSPRPRDGDDLGARRRCERARDPRRPARPRDVRRRPRGRHRFARRATPIGSRSAAP